MRGLEDGVEVERETEGVHPGPDAGAPFDEAAARPHAPGEMREFQLEDSGEEDGVEKGETFAALEK
jgi:hypothetical protein